ncbi:hypothetical protein GA497_19665 [Salmonella enterica]|nr:hypothetical protein [Salmonella enterica]EBL9173679.1 hypothetical protein [Salmonella enterica]EDD2459364.1 hypothetical protein [Salmonella enterica]
MNDTRDIFITMAHIRAAGGCAPGARTWFKKYGLDFRLFIRDGGISGNTLLNTGDAFAMRVVQLARQNKEEI